MTQEELLISLHAYTPYEQFCQKNYDRLLKDLRYAYHYLDSGLPAKLPDSLHLPTFSQELTDNASYREDFDSYTNDVDIDSQKIILIQHDRYTPPILHNHNFYEILYVYEGEFEHDIDNRRFVMRTGDLCLVPPNVYHSLNVNNYSIVLNVLIHIDTFRNIFLNTLTGDNILSNFFLGNIYSRNVNNYILFHTNGSPLIQNLFLNMCLETINKEKYYKQILYTNLLILFGYLLRYYENSSEMPEIKKKSDILDYAVLKYIEDNYRTVTLQALSEKFHYSPQQLSHRIESLTGKNFTAYMSDMRMQKAAELLRNTNMKVREICYESGYHTQEHFNRTFRKYYHTSPAAYRKNSRT